MGVGFSGFGLNPLLPVSGNLKASAYQDILDNATLPTLWEQFGEGPFFYFSITVPRCTK